MAAPWTPLKAPEMESEDGKALAAWMEAELERFQTDSLENIEAVDLRPIYKAPLRPQTGMLIYADGTRYDPGQGEGVYTRLASGVWAKLNAWGGQKELLLADRTYYVHPTGSNTNPGTALLPFQTPQYAYDFVASTLDFGGKNVTIQLQDSVVYTAGVLVDKGWTGGGTLTVQGNAATPGNVKVTGSNLFKTVGVYPGTFTVKDMWLSSTPGACLDNSGIGRFAFGNIEFAASQVHLNNGSGDGGSGSNMRQISAYTVLGNYSFGHIVCSRPSNFDSQGFTNTVPAALAGGIWILSANGAVCVYTSAVTGAGVAGTTGTKYSVKDGAQIYCLRAVGYFPGSIAGTGTNQGVAPWGLYI